MSGTDKACYGVGRARGAGSVSGGDGRWGRRSSSIPLVSYAVAMRCPVLTKAMLLPGSGGCDVLHLRP
eukprot:1803940-Rhodomonas_salina.7